MSDVVVTVPKNFRYAGFRGLKAWCAEGDIAGTEWSGALWCYNTWGGKPKIKPGERVYVVCEDRLRGFAPLVELCFDERRTGLGDVEFIRGGGAEAVTLPQKITGFRGWRYRWWDRKDELAFPDWCDVDIQKQRRKDNERQLSLI